MESDTNQQRIFGLDCLRGVAILAVLFYHAWPPIEATILEQGCTWIRSFLWTGVDLFFVLSGFLITRILLNTREDPKYLTTFYARRSLRVFPLYYLFVAAFIFLPQLVARVFPSFGGLLESGSYQKLWMGQGWLWLYLQNFQQATGPSRFPGMGHLWSLAVEEQFYLVWPWLVWRLSTKNLARVLLGLLLLTCIGRWLASVNGVDPWAIMHLTYFRLDGLIIGSCLAVCIRETSWNHWLRIYRNTILAISCAVVVGIGWLRGTFDWIDPMVQQYGFFAFNLAAGAVVHFIVDRESSSVAPSTTRTGLGFLASWGKYSYGIYVLHMLVYHAVKSALSRFHWEHHAWSLVLGTAVLSYLAAMVSWHAYEVHWLKWKPSYAGSHGNTASGTDASKR